MQVEEHRAALEVVLHLGEHVVADGFEQRVPGGHPFPGGVLLEQFLVEHDVAVFAAKFAEPRFEPLSGRPEVARHAADLVSACPGLDRLGLKPGQVGRAEKKVLDDLGDQTALFGFGGLADDGGQIQFALC